MNHVGVGIVSDWLALHTLAPLALAFSTMLTPLAGKAAAAPTARIESGLIEGRDDGDVSAFLGVPFGADTGGANRWREPQPVKPWKRVRKATAYGDNCPQVPSSALPAARPWTDEYKAPGPASENCLFLNIWTPSKTAAAKLPVMVWIHGGGFAQGSGSVPLYRGSRLAARGIVVVTINYRTGPFGFLAHPALTAEAGSSGNYGLMDQIASLQWVKRNIAAFGGDPDQVTIAGQSAGSASVHALLASPPARGLFIRAIAQSGSGMGLPVRERSEAEAIGAQLQRVAGAASLEQMRRLSPEALLNAALDAALLRHGLPFSPIREEKILPAPRAEASNIPILTGYTSDESSSSGDWIIDTPAALSALLNRRFGAAAPTFARLYGGERGPAVTAAARAMLRDRSMASLSFWFDARPAGSAPVYAYLYTHAEPGPNAARYGAFHSSELAYMFDTLDAAPRPFTAQDHQIADMMADYWANFVRSGNPNGDDLPRWPQFDGRVLMELGDRFAPRPALAAEIRDEFRAFVAKGGELGMR